MKNQMTILILYFNQMEPKTLNYLLNDKEMISLLYSFTKNGPFKKFAFNHLKNKLWRCFLSNDGSMTKMLSELYDGNIHLELLISEKINFNEKIESIEYNYANLINEIFFKRNFDCDQLLIRKICFKNFEELLMICISIWDSESYERIYSQPLDLQ